MYNIFKNMELPPSNISIDHTNRIPARELSTLLKVSGLLASTMNLAEVLRISIESAAELLELDTGAIYTLENNTLYLGATIPPLPLQFPEELRFADLNQHPHIQQAVITHAPVYLEDARKAQLSPAEKIIVDSRRLISILYFPLVLKESAIGTFILGTTQRIRKFSNEEIDLCHTLSYQVSLAIANAQLFQKSQQAIQELTQGYDDMLLAWSRVLDMRDHVTDEHTHRAAVLTVTLARKMGVPESELGHIRRGALLHDIGKMGIPDAILQKPFMLTGEEQVVMQSHPVLAYRLLSQISYLSPAVDIPYCHHEKWDGTGYPRGLKGEEIPLAARIFAVVDVYDALTSDRPYRPAWSKEQATAYLQEQSGKHFYPEAVCAFLELIED
ncbi:MAG TPA: HD domain-containing phosphohydrolase [Anaerolineaceae bacterium]|nr:HD domain-containing phosphohydrolase [Anaerolineaceae bacterium]HOH21484.1 HD domain-containing phosphohydrolase [Anaerolineaceae bacterium]